MLKFTSNWIDQWYVVRRRLVNGRVEVAIDKEGERYQERRVLVCLCGSTRFSEAFRLANLRETLAGRIVLTVGCDTKSDADLIAAQTMTEDVKANLDELHLDKIDLADEILVLNVGGYIGDSTRREVLHASARGKNIRWLEPSNVPADLAKLPGSQAIIKEEIPPYRPSAGDGLW